MRRFFTPAWLVRHAVALAVTVLFCYLGWWQWGRANDGNAISWGYSFQWPAFGLFVLALWWREVRAELKSDSGSTVRETEEETPLVSPFSVQRATTANGATGDAATDEYNRYLAWLADNPGRPHGDYPG